MSAATSIQPVTAPANPTAHVAAQTATVKSAKTTAETPSAAASAVPDTVKLSFSSQARLLETQGLNTGEIAVNLRVPQPEVVAALTEGDIVPSVS